MPAAQKRLIEKIPDFDVLSEDPAATAAFVKERLEQSGIHIKISIIPHKAIGELIPESVEIMVGQETVAFNSRKI
jgi:hypothetical protein